MRRTWLSRQALIPSEAIPPNLWARHGARVGLRGIPAGLSAGMQVRYLTWTNHMLCMYDASKAAALLAYFF